MNYTKTISRIWGIAIGVALLFSTWNVHAENLYHAEPDAGYCYVVGLEEFNLAEQKFTPEAPAQLTSVSFFAWTVNSLDDYNLRMTILSPGGEIYSSERPYSEFDLDNIPETPRVWDLTTEENPIYVEYGVEYRVRFQTVEFIESFEPLFVFSYNSNPVSPFGTCEYETTWEYYLALDIEGTVTTTPVKFNKFWIMPFIGVAAASTSCSFITTGATTTAECSDGTIQNPTQDLLFGIVLFIIGMWLTISFLELRKRRYKDA